MTKIINWERVWIEFNTWYDSNRISGGLLDWGGQRAKIKQLVNTQVREIVKKKI